jgi:hypothetical protein
LPQEPGDDQQCNDDQNHRGPWRRQDTGAIDKNTADERRARYPEVEGCDVETGRGSDRIRHFDLGDCHHTRLHDWGDREGEYAPDEQVPKMPAACLSVNDSAAMANTLRDSRPVSAVTVGA